MIIRSLPDGTNLRVDEETDANTLFDTTRSELTAIVWSWEQAWRAEGVRLSPSKKDDVESPYHLIYAYMIENTRAYEILKRVAWELLHGERLGFPVGETTHNWLSATEELFFSDFAPSPLDVVSRLRPDLAASRRNAYYRMFGMDLNHGTEDGRPYPFEKPQVANRDFVATFEEFLRAIWTAVENATNSSGPNVTDPQVIVDLAKRLRDMLIARRGGAANGRNLAREEIVHVFTMEWVHFTLGSNNLVIRDLRAVAPSPEERLRLIGERVGMPAHARSHSYFRVAQDVARLLVLIEHDEFVSETTVRRLYTAGGDKDLALSVINHWSTITGRDMKVGRVAISPSIQIPSAAPATNGRVAAAPNTN